MIEPIDECIYEINDIMALLIKGDKWAGLANRLTKFLTQKWSDEQKEAIRDAIRFLSAGKGDITKEEFKFVINDLENKLGARLSEVFRKDVQKVQLESYTKGHTEIGIQFEFNTVDKKSLMWLFEKDVKQFWIGDTYTKELNDKLNKTAAEVMKQGLGRDEAGKLFKSRLQNEFSKTNNYWEMLSEHIVTRAREFGRISAYEKAGIEYIKIVAVMDDRTSKICQYLNGRIIPIGKMIKQRDKLLNAKTIEDIKLIAPWYKPREIDTKIANVPTGKLPEGVGIPPYHGHCRTTTVIAYDNEIDTNISKTETPKEIADKLQVKLDNYEQLKPKEAARLKELCLSSNWGTKIKYRGEELASIKYHYKKHRYEDTINASSISDYNQMLFDLIRNASTEVYLTSSPKYGLQIWFYNGENVAIITPGEEKIETFHKMRTNFLLYLQRHSSKYIKLKAKGIVKWIHKLLID